MSAAKMYMICNAAKCIALIAWERCGWVVGGLENQMQDNEPDSDEYKSAQSELADHDGLVAQIYDELMFDTDKGYLKHLRFVGKAFLIERIEKRLTKWGY